jgi:hypothetical protein
MVVDFISSPGGGRWAPLTMTYFLVDFGNQPVIDLPGKPILGKT